jgi:hypothetical protein
VHARKRARETGDRGAYEVADVFCRGARQRVHRLFREVFHNHDAPRYRLARHVLEGRHLWLETGPLEPARGRSAGPARSLEEVSEAGAF